MALLFRQHQCVIFYSLYFHAMLSLFSMHCLAFLYFFTPHQSPVTNVPLWFFTLFIILLNFLRLLCFKVGAKILSVSGSPLALESLFDLQKPKDIFFFIILPSLFAVTRNTLFGAYRTNPVNGKVKVISALL